MSLRSFSRRQRQQQLSHHGRLLEVGSCLGHPSGGTATEEILEILALEVQAAATRGNNGASNAAIATRKIEWILTYPFRFAPRIPSPFLLSILFTL